MTQTDPFATTSATKPADPFGQADGSAPAGDPFGNAPRPDSEFLRSDDLKPNGMTGEPGALLLIRIDTSKVEEKPDNYNESGKSDVLVADIAVLDGPHAGRTQDAFWFRWGAFVGSGQRAKKAHLRCILGRVTEVPTKSEQENAKKFPGKAYAATVEDLPAAYEAVRTGKRRASDKIGVAYILAEHTEEDAVKAREFLAAHPEFLR